MRVLLEKGTRPNMNYWLKIGGADAVNDAIKDSSSNTVSLEILIDLVIVMSKDFRATSELVKEETKVPITISKAVALHPSHFRIQKKAEMVIKILTKK